MQGSKVYTLFSLGARYAASTDSDAIDLSTFDEVVFVLRVTLRTSTPTSLDVSVQGSADGANFGPYKTAVAFTQVTTVSSAIVRVLPQSGPMGQYVRANAAIAGGEAGKTYTFELLAVCKRLS